MPDVPRLRDYQQETLRDELLTERYAGMSADEAYAEVIARPNALRLARTRYNHEDRNLPGFPNKVRRSDFDLVWGDIHGAS